MIHLAGRRRLNRRDLILSSTIGALAGTAWGMAFVDAAGSRSQPGITVIRTRTVAILLIEAIDARILVVDGQPDLQINSLVERAAGFLRRRLDVLIASNTALESLPRGFIDHWRISAVFSLPGDNPGLAAPLSHRELTVGHLRLTATPVTLGEWLLPQPPTVRSWYLELNWHQARCIYVSSGSVINWIPAQTIGGSTLYITNDPAATASGPPSGSVLALPAERIDSATETGDPPRLIRLYREMPQEFDFDHSGFTIPGVAELGYLRREASTWT